MKLIPEEKKMIILSLVENQKFQGKMGTNNYYF